MIHTCSLSKRFGHVPALLDFNLDVPAGAVFALLGPNGAGKTTALRILLNILSPGSGDARVLGVDSRLLGPKEMARIGYVSENRELPDWMRVSAFLAYCRKFYPDWVDSEAAALVRLFELPLNRPLRSLSRGMRMKAALAAALAYRPRLLILDEPFSGLDVVVREQLLECIAERTPESTVLIATHDLSDVEGFATHVGYLSEGRLLFAEEMDTLVARFREVEVVTGNEAESRESLPDMPDMPDTWLNLTKLPGLLRFTHTQYDQPGCEAELRRYWPGFQEIAVRPLPLRAIFIALARSRKANGGLTCN